MEGFSLSTVSASSRCVHTCVLHTQSPGNGQRVDRDRVHLQTPTGTRTLTCVQRPTCRNRWSLTPHPHAVHSGFRQSLPAVCLTLSPGALQLGWPAVWRWTCIGGRPLACMVGREGPVGSTDWIQTVPYDSGGTSLPHRAFPDLGTTQTLGLTENHMPWGSPTPSKSQHSFSPRSFRLALHATLLKTLDPQSPDLCLPQPGEKGGVDGSSTQGAECSQEPPVAEHDRALSGQGMGGAVGETLTGPSPGNRTTSWGPKSRRTRSPPPPTSITRRRSAEARS